MSSIILRLPKVLEREAGMYVKRHGYKNIHHLIKDVLHEKILVEEGESETKEIMKNKKLLASIKKSTDDVKHGRLYTFKEMNELRKQIS